MSEQLPLLPVQDTQQSVFVLQSRFASLLESRPLHRIVITLVMIDTICILASLIYSFLSPGCDPAESPQWLESLAHISLGIIILFLIEIPMALWAFGPRYYNPFGQTTHAALHLFDATIIITTFTLEVVLRGRERELAGMLEILRLWRLVKLVGGIAVGAGELSEEDARRLGELQEQLERVKAELLILREENVKLKYQMARHV